MVHRSGDEGGLVGRQALGGGEKKQSFRIGEQALVVHGCAGLQRGGNIDRTGQPVDADVRRNAVGSALREVAERGEEGIGVALDDGALQSLGIEGEKRAGEGRFAHAPSTSVTARSMRVVEPVSSSGFLRRRWRNDGAAMRFR